MHGQAQQAEPALSLGGLTTGYPQEAVQGPGLGGGQGPVSLSTHAGWAHGCWLQRRRMGLGLLLGSHRCLCTMRWSRRRRQPYLVNWTPMEGRLL